MIIARLLRDRRISLAARAHTKIESIAACYRARNPSKHASAVEHQEQQNSARKQHNETEHHTSAQNRGQEQIARTMQA